MRFIRLANHFGREFRHHIIPMDGVTAAFDHLNTDVDAQLVPLRIHRAGMVRNVHSFRHMLKHIHPDLLVTSNWGTIEWAAASFASGIPHLHMEDGFGSEEAGRQFRRRVWARRILLRHVTTVLPSQTLFRIARDVWRLPQQRIMYIPNGVDCDRFSAPPDIALLDRLGIDTARPIIGTVASLRREKKICRLIDAFAEIRSRRPAQLLIMGDGPERARLEHYAIERGVGSDVLFAGFCPAPEKLLRACTVFAVSSDTEQMPLSVLEAMAAGLPVAATDIGDIRYMLAPENAPFLVPREAVELARAILRILAEPARATEIGKFNQCRARELFDERRMFDAYWKLFEQTHVA